MTAEFDKKSLLDLKKIDEINQSNEQQLPAKRRLRMNLPQK